MLLAARGRRHPFAAARLLPIPLSSGPSFASSTTTTTSNGACSSSAADPDAVAAEVATLLSRCSGDWRLAFYKGMYNGGHKHQWSQNATCTKSTEDPVPVLCCQFSPTTMLLAARGRRHPFAAARLLPIPLSSGPSFASSTTTTTSNGACSSSAADPDAVAAEVATLLSPAAISSLVRRRPSPSSPRLHPKLLLDFFYWSSPQLAPSAPAPDAFAHLAMSLCAGSLFNLANGLLIKMIRAYPSPPVVLASIHRALSDSGHRSPAVLDVLVDTYKKSGRVQDAAEVVLMMRDLGLAPSIRCCNALLKDLLRADAMALLWKVREFMVGAGISPDVYTYSTLIEAYCKVREFDTAKKVLVEMRERGCGLNTVTYNVLIAGLCRSGAVEEAFGFKKDMEDYGLVPDGFTYGALINGLCKSRRSNEAKALLDEMSCAELKPNVVVYANLIDGFMREGNADEAFKMIKEMVAAGVQPNKITYDNLVRGLCKMGQMDRASLLLKQMVRDSHRPDTITYNLIIEGHFRHHSKKDAFRLLSEMENAGISPNVYTYSIMIHGLCQSGEPEKASDLLEEMTTKGLKPNAFVYAPLISGYCREGNVSLACEVFDKMTKVNVLPDLYCYNSLIFGLSKVGRVEESTKYFAQMQERGLLPNEFTYSGLIHGYLKNGDLESAEQLVQRMLDTGLKPNDVIYIDLLESYFKSDDIEKVSSTFKSMLDQGVMLDNRIYGILIHNLSSSGNMEAAFRVLSEIEKNGSVPDVHVYSSLISGLCKTADREKAFGILDEMSKKGVDPNIVCYNALIDGLCKSGDISYARNVFNSILAKGLVPNCVTYTSLIDGSCKVGDISNAFYLYNEMLATGITPDAFVYSVLTTGCSSAGDLEQAMFLIEEMFLRGHASISSFNNLVDGFCKRGKMQETLKLLHVIMGRGLVPNALTIENIISGLSEAGKLSEVHTIFVELQQKTSESAARHFSSLFMDMINQGKIPLDVVDDMIRDHCKEGNLDKALMLRDVIVAKSAPMGCSSYLAIVDNLCRKGKLSEALNLLKEMDKRGNLQPTLVALLGIFWFRRHHHILNKLGGLYIWTHTYSLMKKKRGQMYHQPNSIQGLDDSNEEHHAKKFKANGEAACADEEATLPVSAKLAEHNEENQMEAPLLSGESEIAKKGSWTTTNLKDTIHHVVEELMAPPTLSAILGFVFGLVPWLKSLVIGDGAPLRVIQDSIQLMGNGTIPCVTLILGGNLIKGLRKLEFKHTVIIAIVCIRYVILPLVGIAVVHGAYWVGFLPHDPLYRYVLMMQFALPPAMTIGTMAQLFDVAQEECSVIFLWTYLVSSISLTTWSMIFMSIPSLGQSAMISAFQLTQREEVEDNNTPLEKSRSN
uniref:Auxin efflux carrier component n=1 Tax=Oryza glumipatula TaxID=40148 RepID=A0A0E0AID8_9ORYZ